MHGLVAGAFALVGDIDCDQNGQHFMGSRPVRGQLPQVQPQRGGEPELHADGSWARGGYTA